MTHDINVTNLSNTPTSTSIGSIEVEEEKVLNNLKDTSFFLDASHLKCPMPLAETKKTLKTLNKNEKLLVKTSDPSFLLDIKVLAKKTDITILQIEENNKAHFTLLQK